jgi:hypothetical protein
VEEHDVTRARQRVEERADRRDPIEPASSNLKWKEFQFLRTENYRIFSLLFLTKIIA